MPAGMPYFAWIDPGETTFLPGHMRWDEDIFSFTLKQDEGDPASLTVVVRRPRDEAGNAIGLLGPGRKIWAWFALDCGPDLIRFRGRLVGVPTSIFEELVTLEFVARPIDLVAQKAALADTLRVLPYYDEVVIDPTRRTDPEVVLEGYSKIWHYDRETHVLTVSDEIIGEDGLIEFDGASEGGKVLYDGLALSLTSGPLARVDVSAEYTWTQQVGGFVDLTGAIVAAWPGSGPNYVTSYSMTDADWPKPGASLGNGWIVADSSASTPYSTQVKTRISGSTMTVTFPGDDWFGPSSHTTTYTDTQSYVEAPIGLGFSELVTSDTISLTKNSYSRSYSATGAFLPLNYITIMLKASYSGNRQCTEVLSFSLFADVQPILTDPDDGEALQINDIKSVNLSESIGEGSDAYVPIGDSQRRSYIATARGNQSIEHLIALARANLLKRARVVEIAFAPKLSRMPEITLRKNAFLIEPRVGEALGKIIGYSLALDGSDGRIKCEVRIGCAIGHGGSAVAAGGEPTYCDIDYVGADYQQFTGRIVLFDTSVGYEPPNADPNDDGIDFLSGPTAKDMMATPVSVENPASAQAGQVFQAGQWASVPISGADIERMKEIPAARSKAVNDALAQCATRVTLNLKSMSGEFKTEYGLLVTDLKVPSGYDLEAA